MKCVKRLTADQQRLVEENLTAEEVAKGAKENYPAGAIEEE